MPAISYDGKIRIERGLVRKEDLPKRREANASVEASEAPNDDTSSESGLSAKLVEDMSCELSPHPRLLFRKTPKAVEQELTRWAICCRKLKCG